ncbi:NUDIX domain-containing protein [Candidatus Dojkabacteria bacterium]|nr:NUDIX domain-containing protein [Candidatus Dojkabacteria bacterium]
MKSKRDWKIKSSKEIYKNPWIEIIEDQVVRPDGRDGIYGYIKNHSAVMIVPEDDDGNIVLVNQYRYPSNQDYWELPAGATDHAQDFKEMAEQELFEETGIKAKEMILLGEYIEFALCMTNKNYAYLAKGFNSDFLKDNSEGDEIINKIKTFTVEEVKQMIRDNVIQNSPSLAVLNLYFSHKNKI